jgi:single-strand DNA-binding protein
MYNKVILIGNLTRDVELRYTTSGAAVAKLGLAVNRTWKDRNTGEKRDETCFVDISIFGRSAEVANQHLAKGRRVLIEGRLVFEQWTDQNGQKRSKHSIAAESFQFMDARGEAPNVAQNTNNTFSQPAPQASYENTVQPKEQSASINVDIDDDDVPF